MSRSQPATQTTTTEQRSEPWEASQPYLRDVMQSAQDLFRGPAGTEYMPFSTVVPFAPQTEDALQMTEGLARQGNPLVMPAIDRVGQMLGQGGQVPFQNELQHIGRGGMNMMPSSNIQYAAGGGISPFGRLAQGTFGNAASGRLGNIHKTGMASFVDPNSRITAGDGMRQAAQYQDPGFGVAGNAAAGRLGNIHKTGMAEFVNPNMRIQAQDYLRQDASGQNIGNNPYLDRQFGQAADKVRDRVNSMFSAAGRTGSGMHQDVYQEGLNDLATNIYGGAYETDRNRQMQAASQIGSMQGQDLNRQFGAMGQLMGQENTDMNRIMQGAQMQSDMMNQGFGRQLQAANLQGGFQGQDLNRRFGAMQGLAGLEAQDMGRMLQGAQGLQGMEGQNFSQALQANQQMMGANNSNIGNMMQAAGQFGQLQNMGNAQAMAAIGMIPQLRDMQFNDAARLGQVGSARENLAAEELADLQSRWQFAQESPYARLGQYSGLVNGMGALGGTSFGTTTMPRQRTNPLMGALGGAMSGASMGSMIPGLGTGLGAIGGGLLGLFG